MLELLISELPPSEAERAVLCDVESQLGKPNDTPVYSLEVLDFLTSQNPDESFLLALGPDNCVPDVFHTFYGAARILSDYGVEKIPAQDFERSTLCRTLFKQKTPADVLTSHLPRSIVDYVIQHSLYLEDSL